LKKLKDIAEIFTKLHSSVIKTIGEDKEETLLLAENIIHT
jgi:hypothetical protein